MEKTMKKAHVNGNSKKVRCITTGKLYESMTLAAMDNEVSIAALSYAIRKGYFCGGKEYVLESDTRSVVDRMGRQISTNTALVSTLRQKVTALEEERTKRELQAAEQKVTYLSNAADEAIAKAKSLCEAYKEAVNELSALKSTAV